LTVDPSLTFHRPQDYPSSLPTYPGNAFEQIEEGKRRRWKVKTRKGKKRGGEKK
jgi:hypothetical protein